MNDRSFRQNAPVPYFRQFSAPSPSIDMRRDRSGFDELLGTFARHRWIFIGIFTAFLLSAVVVTLSMTPRYDAEAVVYVDTRSHQIVNVEPVLASPSLSALSIQSQIESEIQLIMSRRVLDQVVVAFNILKDPEFYIDPKRRSGIWSEINDVWHRAWENAIAVVTQYVGPDAERVGPDRSNNETLQRYAENRALDEFMRHLTVKVRGRSTAIEIVFSSRDPVKAAGVANAIAKAYTNLSGEEKEDADKRALASLTSRSNQLRDQVAASDTALTEYRQSINRYDAKGFTATSQRVSEINTHLIQAQADAAASESRVRRIQMAPGGVESAPDVLASFTVQRLREQEANVQKSLAELESSFGDRHPAVIKQRTALDEVRRKLQIEIAKIVKSAEAESIGAQARVTSLRQQLQQSERDAAQQSKGEIRLHELQREADANRSLYEVFLKRIQEVTQQIGLHEAYVQIISPAEPPVFPAFPNRKLFIGCATILSIIVAALAVAFSETLTKGFKTMQHIADAGDCRTLGLVPQVKGLYSSSQGPEQYLLDRPHSAYGEAIQGLRASLRSSQSSSLAMLFTSAVSGEGKTATAISFARMAARSGQRVILIDCDLRRPRLHRILGGIRAGLTDVLCGKRSLEDAINVDPATGLNFITRGTEHGSPVDLLSSSAMGSLLRHLREEYEVIILDSPPVLAVADARILACSVDQTIYVIRWGRTPRRLARMGLEILRESGAQVVGTIFSQVDPKVTGYGGTKYVEGYTQA